MTETQVPLAEMFRGWLGCHHREEFAWSMGWLHTSAVNMGPGAPCVVAESVPHLDTLRFLY